MKSTPDTELLDKTTEEKKKKKLSSYFINIMKQLQPVLLHSHLPVHAGGWRLQFATKELPLLSDLSL